MSWLARPGFIGSIFAVFLSSVSCRIAPPQPDVAALHILNLLPVISKGDAFPGVPLAT